MGLQTDNRSDPGAERGSSYFITEYLSILLKWKQLSLALLLAVVIGGVIAALLLPPLYESETRLLPVGESSLLGSSRFSALSGFGEFVDFGAIGANPSRSALLSILDSDLLRARVARRLDLVGRYGVDHPDPAVAENLAGRHLRQIVSVDVNKWDNIVIHAQAPDSQLVLDVLGTLITELELVQSEMSLTTARRTREFIERRMAEADSAYVVAQRELLDFQNAHGIIAVELQQTELVKLAAQLETRITLKRAELSAARSFYSGEHGDLRRLEVEIAALEQELEKLRRPDVGDAAGEDRRAGPALAELPDLAAEYVRLSMDVEIQQSLLVLLAQQYEQAKISEMREVASFEVVDPPRVPPRASRTRKGTALVAVIIAVLAALAFPLLLESLTRHFPPEARRESGELVRRLLTLRRRS